MAIQISQMAAKLILKPSKSIDLHNKITASFEKLRNYCEKEEFKGYDPYDGLNSRLFQSIPFLRKNRLARLAWIQFFKRSPINFRSLAGVEKDYNPKAMGLFLSGYCQLYLADPKKEYLEKIDFFIDEIRKSVSVGYSGVCWVIILTGRQGHFTSRNLPLPWLLPSLFPAHFWMHLLLKRMLHCSKWPEAPAISYLRT